MSSSTSSSNSSLISIQKPRAKRTLLPKSSLIQLFIENTPLNDLTTTTTPKTRILPKLNDRDLIKQFNLIPSQLPSTTSNEHKSVRTITNTSTTQQPSSQSLKSTASTNQFKKLVKDTKFKQITRLCLYQSDQHHHQHEKPLINDDKSNLNEVSSSVQDLNQLTISQHKNRHNLLKHLSKEFLIDCKQRLDLNTFKFLLELLTKCKQDLDNNTNMKSIDLLFRTNLDHLDKIYQIIKNDFNLCNKFSAFLTSEYAVHFSLFMQSSQYEKTYNLLQKLEIFIPNKYTFKKLIQSIQTSSELSLESNQFRQIIDDIKLKINTATKNNQFINDELEYLFDQRNANLETVYEKVNLLDETNLKQQRQHDVLLNEEFIDLTTHSASNQISNVNKSNKRNTKKNKANLS